MRAPEAGIFTTLKKIGDLVTAEDVIGKVGSSDVRTQITGVLRGLIRNDIEVAKGTKLGDIDPRGKPAYCDTVSEKARILGGAALQIILSYFNR